MKALALLKKIAWAFATLGVLLAFIVLDWLPTVKDLNRLRRERQDEVMRLKNFTVLASGFVFPDQEEKSLFARNKIRLLQSLPAMHDHDGWLATAMLEGQAQARAEGIADARFFFSHHGLNGGFAFADPCQPEPLADWISLQQPNIRRGFEIVREPSLFPWYSVFAGLDPLCGQRPARGGLAAALAAPLPALLDFVNHISWGETRLEIVYLYLQPGASPPRAWLVCRGNYLSREPSHWQIEPGADAPGAGLLIDPDSPLLWREVDPGSAAGLEKKELPPAGSPW